MLSNNFENSEFNESFSPSSLNFKTLSPRAINRVMLDFKASIRSAKALKTHQQEKKKERNTPQHFHRTQI